MAAPAAVAVEADAGAKHVLVANVGDGASAILGMAAAMTPARLLGDMDRAAAIRALRFGARLMAAAALSVVGAAGLMGVTVAVIAATAAAVPVLSLAMTLAAAMAAAVSAAMALRLKRRRERDRRRAHREQHFTHVGISL